MKKYLLLILLLLFVSAPKVMADDVDLPASGELWDNWNTNQDFYGQDKSVTDEDFDKALESLKDKKNKWVNRLKKKQVPKGEEFHQSNETEVITEHSDKQEGLPVVCIPVELEVNGSIIPIGHYQVKAEKEGENVVINFYQAQYLMAKIPAIETDDDFGEDTITFAKWTSEDDNQIKLMFGSMDLNAYTYIRVIK